MDGSASAPSSGALGFDVEVLFALTAVETQAYLTA
jgi:hypothetical protein